MFDKVVALISKPPTLRADVEVKGLVPWFKKKSNLMSSLGNDMVADVIKNCEYALKKKDDVIIKQGDQGDCFYIIINGKISIFIDYNLKKAEEEKKKAEGGEQKEEAEPEVEEEKVDDEKPFDRASLGTFVTSLGQGVPFGEVALVSDARRTASIVSDEVTDLMVINRALYTRCVKNVLDREFEEKDEFINRSPYRKFFGKWSPKYKKQLAMAIYKETYAYDTYLTRQGEPANFMYFILSGEVRIGVDTSSHHSQFPRIFNCYYKGLQMRLDREKNADEEEFERKEKKKPSEARKKGMGWKSDICLLEKNGAIGNAEMLLGQSTYSQTAVCTKTTEVLVLELKHYERLLLKRNPRTIEEMKLDFREKLKVKMKNTTATELKVPFYKAILHYMENPMNVREMTIQEIIRAESPVPNRLRNRSPSPSWSPRTGSPNRHSRSVVERLYPQPSRHAVYDEDEDEEEGLSDVSSDEEFYEFYDEQTSEKSLAKLEDRVRNWMTYFEAPKKEGDRVSRLRRLKDISVPPKAGARVFVRPRTPRRFGDFEASRERDSSLTDREKQIQKALHFSPRFSPREDYLEREETGGSDSVFPQTPN